MTEPLLPLLRTQFESVENRVEQKLRAIRYLIYTTREGVELEAITDLARVVELLREAEGYIQDLIGPS